MFDFLMLQVAFNAYHTKNSDLPWSQPFLCIRARNADVHHNLDVSNPVPKAYTIYETPNSGL